KATPEMLRAALEMFSGFDAVVYTTASSTPEQPRFRYVVRVSRPLEDREQRACAHDVAARLGTTPAWESLQISRLWYRPIRGCTVWRFDGGKPWDVDASLAAFPDIVGRVEVEPCEREPVHPMPLEQR